MNDEEVIAGETTEPSEPADTSDPEPVQDPSEVTYSVIVSNFDEITPYQDLQIALDCMMLGLLLSLIIAIVWVRHL